MRAFLWQKGRPMVDLNALVEKNPSNLHLYWGAYINDSGEILAQGLLPTGDIHAALLVPSGDCKADCERRILASENAPVVRANAALFSMPKPLPIPGAFRIPRHVPRSPRYGAVEAIDFRLRACRLRSAASFL